MQIKENNYLWEQAKERLELVASNGITREGHGPITHRG